MDKVFQKARLIGHAFQEMKKKVGLLCILCSEVYSSCIPENSKTALPRTSR